MPARSAKRNNCPSTHAVIGPGISRHRHAACRSQRNILEKIRALVSAYPPYRPEISQGRLEALLNYETKWSATDRA